MNYILHFGTPCDFKGEIGSDDEPEEISLVTEVHRRKEGLVPEELELSLVSKHHSLWGHRLWNAAIHLADIFDSCMVDVQGLNVLELGAGAGLPGLICALNGAKRVVISDYASAGSDTALVDAIQANVNRVSPFLAHGTLHAVGHIWGNPVDDLLAPLAPPLHLPSSPSLAGDPRAGAGTGAEASKDMASGVQVTVAQGGGTAQSVEGAKGACGGKDCRGRGDESLGCSSFSHFRAIESAGEHGGDEDEGEGEGGATRPMPLWTLSRGSEPEGRARSKPSAPGFEIGAEGPPQASAEAGAGGLDKGGGGSSSPALFDMVLMADLLFNRSQHRQLLQTCHTCLVPGGTAWVTFSHHDPGKAALDLAFFSLATTMNGGGGWGEGEGEGSSRGEAKGGFIVEFDHKKQMVDLFEEGDGLDKERGVVYVYRMTKR